jgi:HAD superfamily hydrolase (TIGR01509 family)
MDKKLIIFDLGGVITLPNNPQDPFENASKKFRIAKDEFEKYFYVNFEDYHFKQVLSQYNFWKKTLNLIKNQVNEDEIDWVINEFNKNSVNDYNPKMVLLIKKLSENYKLVLLSNSSREMDSSLYSSKVIRYFDKICLSHINSEKKPNKRAYLSIIENFRVSPKETLFIDDKKKNVDGALSLGIDSILFENYDNLVEELKKFHINYENS